MIYNMKEIIITVSVLIVCILLIRRIFRGKIGSRFQYALWFLVVLRLMIPVSIPVNLPTGTFGPFHLVEFDTDDVVEQLEKPIQVTINSRNGIYHLLAETSAETAGSALGASENSSFFMLGHLNYSWLDVLGILWAAGMFFAAAWITVTNMMFGRRLKRARREMELSEESESALRGKLSPKVAGMYNDIKIYIVEGLASPCLYGPPGREAVYLTPDTAEDTDRVCHILTHELCHKRHGDGFWGILRGLLVTVYWFHPFVWAAAVLSKRDCELACDETALILLGEEERIAYGETLLSIITRKARISDIVCTATTMTGSGKSVKERIGFIAKKPKVLRMAVAAVTVLMAMVLIVVFTKDSRISHIMKFGANMDTITGADMQIPLPASVREVCGQVMEAGNDDIIIYHIRSKQEVGRFSRMSLKDALQLVDEGRELVPLGDYGDNYLLKAYLEYPENAVRRTTMHTYTPAEPDEGEALGAKSGMLHHEDIYFSESSDGVPGTDSNSETDHVYLPGIDENTKTEYVYGTNDDSTHIPAPEETDSYTIFLPYEEGQSLSAEHLAGEDDTTYILEDGVEYLPNEQITTTSMTYPAKEINIDELSHAGCYVYMKADYSKVNDKYFEEIEWISGELESVAEEVVVLSLNREIREELFDAMTENRTPYVGDNVKVSALVNALPVPPTLNYTGGLGLQTGQEPYSLRFEYEMTRDSIQQEDLDMMYFNAAMMFYAVGNVDEITIDIKHPIGSDTVSIMYVYYRAEMEEIFSGISAADYEDAKLFRDGLEELHARVVEHLHSRGQ